MMDKKCVLVDDNRQDTNEEKIVRIGKSKGIRIETMQFNVGNSELTEVLTDGEINIPKVIAYYTSKFRKYHFDLIAFDWDLNDDKIDGVELIRQFRANNLLRKTNVVLYSGELTEVVKGYFEAHRKDPSSFGNKWTKIKTLIDVPILGFYDRTNYEEKIVEELGNISKHLDLESELIKKLRENSDLVFNNINPRFEGKTFGKVADLIENDIKSGHQFTSELFDQALALLFKLNPKD
jgi:CheY-like chemotaxis protein